MLIYDPSRTPKSSTNQAKSLKTEHVEILNIDMFEEPRWHSESFQSSFHETHVKPISNKQNAILWPTATSNSLNNTLE